MKYGFIGCGNMGGAIARAVSKATKDIAISDRSGKGKALAQELDITYSDNATIAATCDRIFLAVKPYFMKDVLAKLQQPLAENKPLLITMAGGVEIQQIEDYVGFRLPVIRIMPNTPTAIGKGVTQYCCNDLVTEDALQDWLNDMRFCGMMDALEERLIDAASAISGSGPAYMYVFLEALADGAVTCGIPRDKAYEYAAMTMIGSAEMYLATKKHPGALKDAVCSPMGSTICGLRALEAHAFRAAAMDCVIATYERNKEMGK
ncbi:MAG: pyrroline-5-carboxylate reductase [Oscillospiraceae bacterium]|nr:pyrroline-5-carboxylate reductase [Oscillospiraceae bacterium]